MENFSKRSIEKSENEKTRNFQLVPLLAAALAGSVVGSTTFESDHRQQIPDTFGFSSELPSDTGGYTETVAAPADDTGHVYAAPEVQHADVVAEFNAAEILTSEHNRKALGDLIGNVNAVLGMTWPTPRQRNLIDAALRTYLSEIKINMQDVSERKVVEGLTLIMTNDVRLNPLAIGPVLQELTLVGPDEPQPTPVERRPASDR